MSDNQLIIECGMPVLTDGMDAAMALLGEVRERTAAWKAEDLVDDVSTYMLVTGNRTERSLMVVAEMSHEKLEAFVNCEAWVAFMMSVQARCPNFTTNRALNLERLFAANE